MPDQPCPYKSCPSGRLETWASGVDAHGRPVTYSICDSCGRTVEAVAEPADDHPVLFAAEDGSAAAGMLAGVMFAGFVVGLVTAQWGAAVACYALSLFLLVAATADL